jgi:hypothetical protein
LPTPASHLAYTGSDQLSEEADLQKIFGNVNIIDGSLPQAGGGGGYSVVAPDYEKPGSRCRLSKAHN